MNTISQFLTRTETFFLLGATAAYFSAMLLLWSHLFFRPAEDEDEPQRSTSYGSDPALERAMAAGASGASGRGDVMVAPAMFAGAARASGEAGVRRAPSHLLAGRWILWVGVLMHALALIGQGSALFAVRAGVAGLFGWATAIAYLTVGRSIGRDSLGAFVTPVALAATLFSLTAPPLHHVAEPSSLQTPYWLMHVLSMVMGYVALAFAFASSLVYLLQEGLLKRKKLVGLWQKLPSLHVADAYIGRATAFGLTMLTLGLFTGLAWYLQHPSSRAMLYDPKVLISGAMWATFAGSLATRAWLGWSGRRSNLVVVYGFVLLLISVFGTPHLLNAPVTP